MASHSSAGLLLPLTWLLLSAFGAAASPEAVRAATSLGPLAVRSEDGPVTLRLKPPTVRIGLSGDERAILLESPDGLHVLDRDTGLDVWKRIHHGPLRVVLERGGRDEPPMIYRVQVASLADKAEAEALAEHLELQIGEVVEVTHYPERNSWRVRVGQRSSREEIRRVEETLRDLGFAELWVVREARADGPAPRMRLVDEAYNDMLVTSSALLVLPADPGRPIEVESVPYRGVIEIVLTRGQMLKAVNVVNREDYLRGVVPRELGPLMFPELEALKAQAVAARTYVEANRGQFAEDGYDICDTPRCQVYGGIPAEHPMSDFAIAETDGLILTYEGEPINALYTSTCGGHTEDLKNVFREMEGPYLRGVRCYPEEQVLNDLRRTIRGNWKGPPVVLDNGERIDESLAMLDVLGVLLPAEMEARHMAAAPTPADLGHWTLKTIEVIGKRVPEGFGAMREVQNLADLSDYLAEAVGWRDRIEQLVHADDLPVFLGDAVLASTPAESRPALAYMVKEGIVPRVRDGVASGGSMRVTRGVLARALFRIIERYEATGLRTARYRGFQADRLALQADGEMSFYPLSPDLRLIVRDHGRAVAVAEHPMQDGDMVAYHLSQTGEIDYLALEANRRGASDDRFSGVYLWEVRIPREELEARIRNRVSIGHLVDLKPGRRGVSGRLVEMTVIGTAGRFRFHGFSIERLLGLRETLFLVDRQYDEAGRVETFVFSGKGWGHGVGMCQVGAFGMALRGKTFEEILSHYYTGVKLERR